MRVRFDYPKEHRRLAEVRRVRFNHPMQRLGECVLTAEIV